MVRLSIAETMARKDGRKKITPAITESPNHNEVNRFVRLTNKLRKRRLKC